MSGYVEMGRVLRQEQLSADVWRMEIFAPKQAAEAKVGQFVNIRIGKGTAPLLRRPISYAGFDRDKGTIEILYRVVGTGTKLLTSFAPGDEIDCLGPLGRGFTASDNMLLIGGGVGIAPILCMVRHLTASQKATVLLGFRSQEEAFWADLFKPYDVDVLITTDDGSMGTKGYPTTVLPELLATGGFSGIATCGPTVMMKGVAAIAAEKGVPCEVSLEERMGCGVGGCVACSCAGASGKRHKVCLEGPVFPAEEVFF